MTEIIKLSHLTLSAGRHLRIHGTNQTFCDSRMANMEVDASLRCVLISPIKDGKATEKTILVPFESIAFAVPMQAEPVEGAVIRRRQRRDIDRAPEVDAE